MKNTILALAAFMVCSRAVPALAEIDVSGSWASINHEDSLERGGGPYPDDWTGLPFNESGRAKALSFSQSTISMPERTCWFWEGDLRRALGSWSSWRRREESRWHLR